MRYKRNSKGFTLAEMLLVVAIIIILMGVSFVAVQNYQRSSTRLEYDAIAKEIFIAAQNHLTEAASQGYLQNTDYGQFDSTVDEDKDNQGNQEAWYVVSGSDDSLIRTLMLPGFALDGTVLSNRNEDGSVRLASYIIRYQPASAKVLDVFYTRNTRTNFLTLTGTTFTSADYTKLMGNAPKGGTYRENGESNREHYDNTNAIIGWYGGEGLVSVGERLKVPTFEIINAEQLQVKVTDPNDGTATLKLIVIGKKSKAKKYFTLNTDGTGLVDVDSFVCEKNGNYYSIILDDITTKDEARGTLHFKDIMKTPDEGEFLAGEDLEIKVVAFSSTKLSNIAESEKKVTNSLFSDPDTDLTDTEIDGSNIDDGFVAVANIRHLENLDKNVSAFVPTDITLSDITAKQMTDLSWPDFKEKTDKEDTQIHYGSESTKNGCFYPVSADYKLGYDGQSYSVSDVKVEHEGPAGLFGSLSKDDSSVTNLELIDFDITGTTSAGALVGTATGTTISNVVAYNSVDESGKEKLSKNIEATGAAGGLIGSMIGGKVEKSAAAVYVKGGSAAGGLIGSAASGTVTACYSGGHTYSGAPAYDSAADRPDPRNSKNTYPVRYYDADNKPMYNVTGTTVGGLIGSAGAATISNSYSTCSASGTTAGGFVGTGGAISNSYCTGLVKGTTAEGAFAALDTSLDPNKPSYYFEIINERSNTDSSGKPAGYDYLKPLGDVEADVTPGITALDASADTYNSFSGGPTNWKEAEAYPYDAGGTDSYGLKVLYRVDGKTCYNFPTVEKLNQSGSETNKIEIKEDDFVKAPYSHYGDWPAPEEFIFN